MPFKPSLSDIITTTPFWLKVAGGYAPSESLRSNISSPHIYTAAEFAKIHPSLPVLLEDDPYSDLLAKEPILLSLEFWNTPQVSLPVFNATNDNIISLYWVRHVTNVKWEENATYVEVRCSRFILQHTKAGVACVRTLRNGVLLVPTDWMMKNHPTLASRFLLGKTLELGPDALREMLFLDSANIASEPLPVMEF